MVRKDAEAYLAACARKVDRALDRFLPKPSGSLATLYEAIRYMVLPGGKRIRPAVVMASCEAFGGKAETALPAACAVELIHSYSLVHDDLPCMDDADSRRGRPSCHIKYGEAGAVLVGDALQAMAFEVLGPKGELAAELARWVGPEGLVGGQVLDLEKGPATLERVREIHARKTAALFIASARLGACSAPKALPKDLARMEAYGRSVGLLFQTVDDLLDRAEEPDKLTLPGVGGVDEAFEEARTLAARARKAAGGNARLAQIADLVVGQVEPALARKSK
ncbi:MAG TPA: polyprenyl synthetase family protein [Planctomycetota bacterium]|nr:polyprenyl synthetase family protein [Planctomycetota bacterium]